MGRFIVIVLDSFGVGAMDDVTEVRPEDEGSNTALHIIEDKPSIKIPALLSLGLINAIGEEREDFLISEKANWGKSKLSHQGADSFLGHQEIMGTIPPVPFNEPFNTSIDKVKTHLTEQGYSVRKVGDQSEPNILIVNECVSIGDNLETDLGQVYNVSGCLDLISFEELTEIGRKVREVVKVSRVITFGGEDIALDNLLNARKTIDQTYAGVDAPESGVYNKGYQVIHLGYGIDPTVQIPSILDEAGIDVSLIGKVADIVQTRSKRVFPGVDSQELFDHLSDQVEAIDHGFICLNIQETDLAGHAEDVDKYADRLAVSDRNISQLIEILNEDDILIVMADHGNDPTIGHSQHTRENVPLLIYSKYIQGKTVGLRETMSDIAATAAEYFKVKKPANGTSFLNELFETD
ncbi:phosphopentomutase [Alkalibacterium pelagium]|uniref:Phosphopentomutase n=1 Tax=Alkalibacterium pelagium TaxID=426702 RepID=A0A1H7HU04_9LACT|nr:phosphopentomutase [Alkalibacterium pelagium]GEN50343.1 phosphopentomutase [Alkalibacterium pelagium]SEK53749.1 Phosphopentomutase [Alkalibacterium pelagium]